MELSYYLIVTLLISACCSVISIALCITVFAQDPRRTENQMMALCMLAAFVWATSFFFVHLFLQLEIDTKAFVKSTLTGRGIQVIFLYGFACVMIRDFQGWKKTAFWLGVLFYLTVFPYIVFGGHLVHSFEIKSTGEFTFQIAPGGFVALVITNFFRITAIVLLWKHRNALPSSILYGVIFLTAGVFVSLTPIRNYIPMVLFYAVSGIFLSFAILQKQLFHPLEQSHQQLAQSERRYRVLAESMYDYACVLQIPKNGTAQFSWLTEGFTESLGYSEQELLEKDRWKDLVEAREIPIILEKVERLMEGSIEEFEGWIYSKQGEVKWMHLHVHPVFSPENPGELRFYGSGKDLSHRKYLEDRLFQAQKMEAIGQMAGGIAHNFNNFLTAIQGLSELAMFDLPEKHPVKNDLKEILHTAKRASHLTRQMLAMTRRQAGNPVELEVNQIISDMEPIFKQFLKENITLEFQLESALPAIFIDTSHFEQVLINLVINAGDSMKQGGSLSIKTEYTSFDFCRANANNANHTKYNDYIPAPSSTSQELEPAIKITVKDTGEGIPTDMLPHIFEPFFSTKGMGQGTGLGLYSCFAIISNNKGHIKVHSSEHIGTTFEIFFPISDWVSEPKDPSYDLLEQVQSGRGSTILLAEDEQQVRSVVVRSLKRMGYDVWVAKDGQEALELANSRAEQKIDLLLTDLIMPRMDGHILIEKLLAQRPSLKILMISGYSDKALPDLKSDGQMLFLSKPFEINVLLENIQSLLNQ